MKQTEYGQMVIYQSDAVEEIMTVVEEDLPEQFGIEVLRLLKETNPFEQEYYYAKSDKHYAFYTLYKSKMDILTFGKIRVCYFKFYRVVYRVIAIFYNNVIGIVQSQGMDIADF